ncbi:MAG: alpha-L-fucosidase [Flavobacteriaceae bacterium]|nr:MAG: alpha-L-fucosidase [Flavobacteriaceae bacterium]
MKNIILFLILAIFTQNNYSQKNYTPSQENIKAREWFKNAKFGLFIHWGVYSILGDGEWVMNTQNIAIEEYEKLPSFFNPIDFKADQWVKMAKDAGMKYITITSRHHDGFSMYDSKITDYTIVKKTPYKKDPLKELAIACKKEGIKLFFYYSLLDWHDDNYFPRGKTGTKIPGRKQGEWKKYIAFMKGQLTELLTNYGDIAGIWFDGDWDQRVGDVHSPLTINWHYDEIYTLIHNLQPQCLIGNNRHLAPLKGEDFQMFERDLPGETKTKFGTKASELSDLPREVCGTINGNWGFNLKDRNHKSKKQLIHYLVKAAGYGSNLLLNVGPMPNGKIQPNHIKSLAEIGKWLRKNGATIYHTVQGPIASNELMVSTKKGKKIYLHLLDTKQNQYFIKGFKENIKSITFFSTGKKVDHKKSNNGLFIEVPKKDQNDIDTIIEIELK